METNNNRATNSNNDYLKELLRPRTFSEKVNGALPAVYEILFAYKLFELFSFPFMMATTQYGFLNKVFDYQLSYPVLSVTSIIFTVIFLVYQKRQIFVAWHNYYTINKKKIPKVTLVPATDELFQECQIEKKRIEDVIRPKYEMFFAVKDQGFTLMGSTCIRDMEYTTPVHNLGIYWNSPEFPPEFLPDMEKLGYINLGCSLWNNDATSTRLIHKDTNSTFGYEIIICKQASYNWLWDSLIFCEYLTNFKPERELYKNIKEKNKDCNLIDYWENKKNVMLELRAKAKDWKNNVMLEEQKKKQAESIARGETTASIPQVQQGCCEDHKHAD